MSDPIDDPRRLAIAAIVRIDDEGAYANVTKHLADPTHNNIFTSIGSLY